MLLRDGHLSASLIHFWPGNAISVRTRVKLPKNEWHHVAITYDGSTKAGGLEIYVDGKLVETEIHKDNLYKNITGGGGDTIVIGGLLNDEEIKSLSGVPFLKDIPVLGELFRARDYRRTRSELVIFASVEVLAPYEKPETQLPVTQKQEGASAEVTG